MPESPQRNRCAAADGIARQLRELLGPAHVLVDGDLRPYTLDWRKRFHGSAAAVVQPGSTAEVVAVVQACAAAGISIVAQGGNTGLVGAGVPDDSGTQVVLSTKRLNRIREVDSANATITVEAGCTLADVQAAAEQAGLLFPLSLASEADCTIGGNLASNAGGTQVLRYGNARELCLGLEVVTAQGKCWDGLSGLRKDNTGYSLRDLFIGSEGTLGVITAATLRLFPRPATQLTAWVAVPSLDAACALLQLARQQLDAGLTGFEAMNAVSVSLVRRHFPLLPYPLPTPPSQPATDATWSVLLDYSDANSETEIPQSRLQALLAQGIQQGLVQDAAIASNLTQTRSMWHLRECIPLAQAAEGLNVKHDIGLPTSGIPDFVRHTDALLRHQFGDVRLVTFGHLGDGNLHYNVQAPLGMEADAFLRTHESSINRLVYDAVAAMRGTISAEHGIGQLKRDELLRHRPAVALDMMRSIKRALDPHDLFNPGRLI